MKILINEKLSEHKYKTPEGYLICVDSVLARTGKQTYRRNEVFGDSDDDSEIEVDRPAKEVFSDATLASFENKPITVEHPDEDVNAENYKDYAVGFVRDVHKGVDNEMDVIVGTLVITDAKTIEEIENGEHTDLSCGYDCDIMDEENPYQKNIRGNHVALCAQGRAGNARIVDTAFRDNMEEETMTKDEIIDELLEDGNSFTYKNVLVIKTPYGWKFKLKGKTYEVATDEEAKEEIDESVKDSDMKDAEFNDGGIIPYKDYDIEEVTRYYVEGKKGRKEFYSLGSAKRAIDRHLIDSIEDDKNRYRQLAQEINQKFAGRLKEKVGFDEYGITSDFIYGNDYLVRDIVNFIKSKGHKVQWNDIGDDGTFYIIDSIKLDKIFNNKDSVKDATSNKEWERVCKVFCKKIGAELLFVNDYSFGYEDKNGRLIHMRADELKSYLQKNNMKLDALIAPPENVLREVENQLKRAGFKIESKKKHFGGEGIHYQVRLPGKYTEKDLRKYADILHKIMEYADKQGCPSTWNVGLGYDDSITAGLDVREKYVKDSAKDATNNKEWELVCKTFCKKIGATLLFVNDYSFGYEDKNGRMIHMSADELQRYLQRNNINLK